MTISATPILSLLRTARDHARTQFFADHKPGNLKPAQDAAWNYRNMALLLNYKAAQMEFDAEEHMAALIQAESASHG